MSSTKSDLIDQLCFDETGTILSMRAFTFFVRKENQDPS